jgi:hypothetical protein
MGQRPGDRDHGAGFDPRDFLRHRFRRADGNAEIENLRVMIVDVADVRVMVDRGGARLTAQLPTCVGVGARYARLEELERKRRPSRESRATYTIPIPPRPRTDRISQGPTPLPGLGGHGAGDHTRR